MMKGKLFEKFKVWLVIMEIEKVLEVKILWSKNVGDFNFDTSRMFYEDGGI